MMDVNMENFSSKETKSDTSVNITKSANNNEHTITSMEKDAIITNKSNANENDNDINNKMEIVCTHKGIVTEQQQINCKSLKRCLSVPNIGRGSVQYGQCGSSMTLRSAAAASALKRVQAQHEAAVNAPETPKKYNYPNLDNSTTNMSTLTANHNIHIAIPRSREVSPAPMFNIFAPRARRYSASFSPSGAGMAAGTTAAAASGGAPLYLTPRVSQLRKEECADVNTREVNHEREVHSAIQMSQSWEDLTLTAENWSCKSDELSNPLQVALPAVVNSCSSPSPTNNRPGNMRLPYGLSPSPTRRTFATRRSMSPIAMRPSQLGPVKRKFDLEDQSSGNWSVYSPPPLKKIFTER